MPKPDVITALFNGHNRVEYADSGYWQGDDSESFNGETRPECGGNRDPAPAVFV
jgi:hypothetical protein